MIEPSLTPDIAHDHHPDESIEVQSQAANQQDLRSMNISETYGHWARSVESRLQFSMAPDGDHLEIWCDAPVAFINCLTKRSAQSVPLVYDTLNDDTDLTDS